MSTEEKAPLLKKGSGAPPTRKSFFLPRDSPMRHVVDEVMVSFSLTDRQRTLEVVPGVGPAASMIKDAVLGYQVRTSLVAIETKPPICTS